MEKLKIFLRKGGWSVTCVCMVIGFMLTVQFRNVQQAKSTLSYQRVDELSVRLRQLEEERNNLKNQLQSLQSTNSDSDLLNELKIQAGLVALKGTGIIIKLDDSTKEAKSGENPNLYLIHDDDILRVINELRAAGAEAVSINGQRLIDTSEIRCAGPTLSVNNVRSAAPYEIHAIGDKKSLENAINMRGGVAETLKVWGIHIKVESSNDVYVPAFTATRSRIYSHIVDKE